MAPVLTRENWDKTKTGSKKGFDTVWAWADKLGAPVNKLTNKIGSEAFWPTTLDKESDKAARILQSFCKDGFYSNDEAPMTEEARRIQKYTKQRVIKNIPTEVIRKAKGLAIFTTMRTGLWVSGAGGSGILLARMENGEWSPPSGLLIHTAALGFVFGADIYDCVVVINSEKALEAFKALRVTLGGELSAVAGPVGIGGVVDADVHLKTAPIFTYMKSRGFYAGLGANGSLMIERSDENERFYREKISAADILKGKVRQVPKAELKMLWQTLKAAQGDTDVDQAALPDDRPTPGDLQVERMSDYEGFGLPDASDPDPFGVHALEESGIEIHEAGTHAKPSAELFEYKPAPTSPAYAVLHRKSLEPGATPAISAIASAISSPNFSRRSSQTRVKGKMSNPYMVPYVDAVTQTVGDETRDEEIGQEALNWVPKPIETISPPLEKSSLVPSSPLTLRRVPPPPLPYRAPMLPQRTKIPGPFTYGAPTPPPIVSSGTWTEISGLETPPISEVPEDVTPGYVDGKLISNSGISGEEEEENEKHGIEMADEEDEDEEVAPQYSALPETDTIGYTEENGEVEVEGEVEHGDVKHGEVEEAEITHETETRPWKENDVQGDDVFEDVDIHELEVQQRSRALTPDEFNSAAAVPGAFRDGRER